MDRDIAVVSNQCNSKASLDMEVEAQGLSNTVFSLAYLFL
jgi:hypothetical protein